MTGQDREPDWGCRQQSKVEETCGKAHDVLFKVQFLVYSLYFITDFGYQGGDHGLLRFVAVMICGDPG